MSDESPSPKKAKRGPLLLSVLCASGITSGATFYFQKQNTDHQINKLKSEVIDHQELTKQSLKEKDALIQQERTAVLQEREAIQQKLNISAEQYQEKYQATTSELSNDLKEKEC